MQNILTAISSKFANKTQLIADIRELKKMKHGARNSFENVISLLERIVSVLLEKIQFLEVDRTDLLRENHQLNEKIHSLQCVLELKNNLVEPIETLFQIHTEQFHLRNAKPFSDRINIPRLELQKSQQHLMGMQSQRGLLSIRSEDKFRLASQQLQFRKMQSVTPDKLSQAITLGNELVLKCSLTESGVIRAFYLNALLNQDLSCLFITLMNQIKNDTTIILFQQYPTNGPFVMLLIEFINDIRRGHIENELDLLGRLQSHVLLDTLLISVLKSRIEFTLKDPTVQAIYKALSNEFQLKLQIIQTINSQQFVFYRSNQSQLEDILISTDEVQSEIKSVTTMPLFMITHTQEGITFPFKVIKKEQSMHQSYVYSQNSQKGMHKELSDIINFSGKLSRGDSHSQEQSKKNLKPKKKNTNYNLSMGKSSSSSLNANCNS